MIISRKYEFVYIGPPKTASTSVHSFFESPEFEGERFKREDPHNSKVPDFAKCYLRIISARNPYDRVVSLWNHSQRVHARSGWPPRLSFSGFLEWVFSAGAVNFYRSSVSELVLNQRFDMVIHVESLAEDLARLPFIQHPVVPPMRNASVRDPWPLYYNQASANLVWKWQYADFQRFKYERLSLSTGRWAEPWGDCG